MHKPWPVLTAALIGAASFQAPSAHVHAHRDGDHHGGFAHSHWTQAHHHEDAHHNRSDGEWELIDEDETAISVEWTPEATQRIELNCAETEIGLVCEAGFISAGAVPEFTPHCNSPPVWRLFPPRAPPL